MSHVFELISSFHRYLQIKEITAYMKPSAKKPKKLAKLPKITKIHNF